MREIEIGKTYVGTISRIAEYGIFVDLGVVSGLAHISELTWDKNQKLEDFLIKGNEKIKTAIQKINGNGYDGICESVY